MKQASTTMERFAAATAGAAFLAGAWLCWLLPERAWAWLIAMLAMPVVWGLLHTFVGYRPGFQMRKLAAPITGAGLMLTVAMLAVIAQELAVIQAQPGELPDRAWGLILGSMIAVYANVIPKQAASFERARILRFCGWALVLGGLGYALVWLSAPLNYAQPLAIAILAIATLAALLRAFVGSRGNSANPPSLNQQGDRS